MKRLILLALPAFALLCNISALDFSLLPVKYTIAEDSLPFVEDTNEDPIVPTKIKSERTAIALI